METKKEGVMKNALASGWMPPRQNTNFRCFRGIGQKTEMKITY